MNSEKSIVLGRSTASAPNKLGTLSYLVIFIWSLVMVIAAPERYLLPIGILCFLIAAIVYPSAFQKIMKPRILLMVVLFALPPIFLLGDLDRSLFGLSYSSEGLVSSLKILLRVLVMLVAVNGFTSSVDITSIAGMLERCGLKGLGFSLGVALNLLPCLQTAALSTWHSLWMRGGLRSQRWRGIRLLLLTIITNALRRTEEIALAAEGRAFCPEDCRSIPLYVAPMDWGVMAGAVTLTLGFFLVV